MKIISALWICAVFTAVFHLSTATALGTKPPMEDSTSAKAITKTITKTTANTSIAVEVLYRDQQCSGVQAQARWIDSPQAYQSLFEELRKTYIGGQGNQPPPVDLSADGVLLVAMGQKNTGGYAVDLADNEAVVEAGVLNISVQWREPRRGMMVTQALTSPCMLLRIPRVMFERIEIKDQSGATRLSGTR
jgi:hypothetical protein